MRNDNENDTTGTALTAPPKRRVLELDVDYFQQFLDGEDLTPTQKRELLETLWAIVCEFVAMGFDVHPLQQVLPPEGGEKSSQNPAFPTLLDRSMVQSELNEMKKEANTALVSEPLEEGA